MQHIHAPVSARLLQRLLELAGEEQHGLRAILGRLSPGEVQQLGGAVQALLDDPLVVVRDETLLLGGDALQRDAEGSQPLRQLLDLLDELDARGLAPDRVRRVQARLVLNPGCSAQGFEDIELRGGAPLDTDASWWWDLQLAYGGSAAWADEWLPHGPRGGLWLSASAGSEETLLELGRVDEAEPTLRVPRVGARMLRVGWVEGGWGQGIATGLGLVYGDRYSPELSLAVDEVLSALAPAVGRLFVMPGA